MVSPEALEGSVVSRETRLRERKEKVRKRARERKALVYATQKRAREERGIGSIGLSHDVLREIVALAASSLEQVRCVARGVDAPFFLPLTLKPRAPLSPSDF